MRTFAKILLTIALIGHVFIGLFLLVDITQIAANHTFFAETAFAGREVLFGIIYLVSFMCIILIAMLFLMDGGHWKTITELNTAITKSNKTQALYAEAKDDLALTVFDYHQRVKEYKRMINPQPKTKKDGFTTETD